MFSPRDENFFTLLFLSSHSIYSAKPSHLEPPPATRGF